MSGGIAFSIFFSRKHSPSENAGTPRFHSPFSDISFSLRVEIATISALSFRSLVPHSLGSPICVRVHHSGPTLIVDIGCRPNSPRSKYEVQDICFDFFLYGTSSLNLLTFVHMWYGYDKRIGFDEVQIRLTIL